MDNFKLGNIFNNQNINQTQFNKVSEQKENSANTPNQNNVVVNSNKEMLINPNMLYTLKMAKMDSKEVMMYLQNLMKMPKNIEEFIKENQNLSKTISNSVSQKQLTFILENMLNIKLLSNYLNESSKNALQKSLQMMSEVLKTGVQPEQLKEIVSILASIGQNIQVNNQNSIKELFLVYIPVNYQDFNKEINYKPTEDENEAIKNSSLSLIFETINYMNLLCNLSEENNSIFITVFSKEDFPTIKFKNILKQKIERYNINPDFEFNFNKTQEKNEIFNQNFKVISKDFISINLLLLAHKIVETVFEIDNLFNNDLAI